MTFSTVQLLRFIAAFLVLLFHLRLMDSGYKGVDIFFVISGYVMYLKLFSATRPRPGIFFVNRFTKIFFLYWIALFLFYIANPFPLNATLFFNSLFLIPGKPLILGLGWTLTYELYFYLLIGAIAYLIPGRYTKPVLLSILLLSSIITFFLLFLHFHVPGTTFLLGKYTWEFFLGLLSGYLSGRILKLVKVNVILPIVVITLIFLLVINVSRETISLAATIYGLLSMLLICFATACEKKAPISPGIAKSCKILGDASYGIYLLGPLVTILISGNDVLSKALIIIVTIAVAIFFNRTIEQHGLAYCRKLLYRLAPPVKVDSIT